MLQHVNHNENLLNVAKFGGEWIRYFKLAQATRTTPVISFDMRGRQ
jgi:hypothetical protein